MKIKLLSLVLILSAVTSGIASFAEDKTGKSESGPVANDARRNLSERLYDKSVQFEAGGDSVRSKKFKELSNILRALNKWDIEIEPRHNDSNILNYINMLVQSGEAERARLELDICLEKDPDNKEYLAMYEKLSMGADENIKSESAGNNYRMWAAYNEAMRSKNLGGAKNILLQIKLQDPNDNTEAELKKIDVLIDDEIGTEIDEIEAALNDINGRDDLYEKFAAAASLYAKAGNLNQKYEGCKRLEEIDGRISLYLDGLSRTIRAKHLLIKKYEGCINLKKKEEHLIKLSGSPELWRNVAVCG